MNSLEVFDDIIMTPSDIQSTRLPSLGKEHDAFKFLHITKYLETFPHLPDLSHTSQRKFKPHNFSASAIAKSQKRPVPALPFVLRSTNECMKTASQNELHSERS
jgi:hypothetical protein